MMWSDSVLKRRHGHKVAHTFDELVAAEKDKHEGFAYVWHLRHTHQTARHLIFIGTAAHGGGRGSRHRTLSHRHNDLASPHLQTILGERLCHATFVVEFHDCKLRAACGIVFQQHAKIPNIATIRKDLEEVVAASLAGKPSHQHIGFGCCTSARCPCCYACRQNLSFLQHVVVLHCLLLFLFLFLFLSLFVLPSRHLLFQFPIPFTFRFLGLGMLHGQVIRGIKGRISRESISQDVWCAIHLDALGLAHVYRRGICHFFILHRGLIHERTLEGFFNASPILNDFDSLSIFHFFIPVFFLLLLCVFRRPEVEDSLFVNT
mmetsp:Transcript_16866/g.24781  ORF Transcript_16866/g.24781 Transcript_16866/m.24781 type:complete len:318 (-) Transcript_16866:470-1423(-)